MTTNIIELKNSKIKVIRKIDALDEAIELQNQITSLGIAELVSMRLALCEEAEELIAQISEIENPVIIFEGLQTLIDEDNKKVIAFIPPASPASHKEWVNSVNAEGDPCLDCDHTPAQCGECTDFSQFDDIRLNVAFDEMQAQIKDEDKRD